jgi:hypothetical protein
MKGSSFNSTKPDFSCSANNRLLMASPYQHEQLSIDCSRLILLHSDDSSKPVHTLCCDVSVVPFGAAPAYKALSYVWGDSSATDELWSSGKCFQITKNLSLALHQLRSCNEWLLWIHQLCIDQTNQIERSLQVCMMGSIYSRAVQVIMWLGSDPQGDASRVVEFSMEIIYLRSGRPFPEGTVPDDESLLRDSLPEMSSIK